jgi:valyl-tRNA synthetase
VARIDELRDHFVAIRNARATSGEPASAWLATHLVVPGGALQTFQALAPAIGRLARARPLQLHARREDLPELPNALDVVLPAGDFEARMVRSTEAGPGVDRSRLERELAEGTARLEATRARLADARFLERAPEAIIAGARTQEADLAAMVARLRERLA